MDRIVGELLVHRDSSRPRELGVFLRACEALARHAATAPMAERKALVVCYDAAAERLCKRLGIDPGNTHTCWYEDGVCLESGKGAERR